MNKILITMLCIVSLTAVSAPVELRIGRAAKIKPGSNWESVCRELLKSGDKERQFLLTGTSPIRKQTTDNYLADDQTEFAAAEDGRNLYLAVRCYDSRGRNLTARCVEHDGPVWKDDDIEIFIAPRYRGKDYYQFIVNPLGTMYEGRCQDREWGCDWKAKVVRGTDAWTIFCMIPLRAVGIKSDSGFIGFNIYRSRCAGDGSEFSSWSYLSGGPHNTGEFGILVLGEAGKGLGAFIKSCRERKRQIDSLCRDRATDSGIKALTAEIDATLAKTGSSKTSIEELTRLCSNLDALLNKYEKQVRDKKLTKTVKATIWL